MGKYEWKKGIPREFEAFQMQDETFKEHLNQYNVIFLNMQQFLIEAAPGKVTEYLEQEVLEELNEGYGDILKGREMRLAAAFRKIYAKTDKQFIFLIDEWDCIMRERQESETLQKQYLDFLRNLLKDQEYVALAYMTGILPVKKYGQHSALNMFWKYSMTNQFAFEEYTGFTEEEVKELCRRFDMDFAEASNWYDGYKFKKYGHIYNPKSVAEAMSCGDFSNYWTSTETYEALKIYIDMDFDGLRADIVQMLGGGCVKVNTRSFQNDMRNFRTKDDMLTLLIHLGYLAYDSREEEAFIPNREIIGEFENAMSVSGWPEIVHTKGNGRMSSKGTNLSSGQRQRILIARAIAAKPGILILDDASSALDYKIDANLRQALKESMSDSTVVTVAQRVSSVKKCDLIIVLDEGRIIGRGRHEELMENCTEYRQISDSQMGDGLYKV